MAMGRQLLVQLGTGRFPGDHFFGNFLNGFRRVAYNKLSGFKDGFRFYETHGPYNTLIANYGIVHDDAVHPNQTIPSQLRPMDHGPVAYMGTLLKHDAFPGEHVDGTVFLYIHAIFQDDLPPVAPNGGPWAGDGATLALRAG